MVLIIQSGKTQQNIFLQIFKSIKTYTTSANKQLVEKVLEIEDSVVLDAESVTTVVYELK